MIGNEPFLVAPGDHVYSPGCVQDILVAYKALEVQLQLNKIHIPVSSLMISV
jgi:hypothetical protein